MNVSIRKWNLQQSPRLYFLLFLFTVSLAVTVNAQISIAEKPVIDSKWKNMTGHSVIIREGDFGGRKITLVHDDPYIDSYVDEYGQLHIKPHDKTKLAKVKEYQLNMVKDSVSPITIKLPVIDKRKPIFENISLSKADQKKFNITWAWEFTHYETILFSPIKENHYSLLGESGLVHVGFNSDVYSISDFMFGTHDNISVKYDKIHLDPIVTRSLISWWTFDGDARDYYGVGDGVASLVHLDDCIFDQCYNYTAGGEKIMTNLDANIIGGNWTACIWAYSTGHDMENYMLFGADDVWWIGSGWDYDVKIFTWNTTGHQTQIDFNTKCPNRGWGCNHYEWYFFCARREGTNLSIIANGDVAYSRSTTITGELFESPNKIGFGEVMGANFYNGTLDNAMLFNDSLTNAELKLLYEESPYTNTGIYTSGIIDRRDNVSWQSINFTYTSPTNTNITGAARSGSILRPSTDGLWALWTLNQTEGNTTHAFDSSGNGRHATINNGVVIGDGVGVYQGENATDFNGVNQYLTATTTAFNNITIMAWVKVVADGSVRMVIGRSWGQDGIYYDGATSQFYGIFTTADDGGIWLFMNAPENETWYHLTLTYNGTHANTYVNGNHVTQQAATGALTQNAATWGIGWNGNNGYWFKDSLSYVSIHNRALLQNEIMNWSAWTGYELINNGIDISTLPGSRFMQWRAFFQAGATNETSTITGMNYTTGAFNTSFDYIDFNITLGTETVNYSRLDGYVSMKHNSSHLSSTVMWLYLNETVITGVEVNNNTWYDIKIDNYTVGYWETTFNTTYNSTTSGMLNITNTTRDTPLNYTHIFWNVTNNTVYNISNFTGHTMVYFNSSNFTTMNLALYENSTNIYSIVATNVSYYTINLTNLTWNATSWYHWQSENNVSANYSLRYINDSDYSVPTPPIETQTVNVNISNGTEINYSKLGGYIAGRFISWNETPQTLDIWVNGSKLCTQSANNNTYYPCDLSSLSINTTYAGFINNTYNSSYFWFKTKNETAAAPTVTVISETDIYMGLSIFIFTNVALYVLIFHLINNIRVDAEKLIQKYSSEGDKESQRKVINALKIELSIKGMGLLCLSLLNLIICGYTYYTSKEISASLGNLALPFFIFNVVTMFTLLLIFVLKIFYFPFGYVTEVIKEMQKRFNE